MGLFNKQIVSVEILGTSNESRKSASSSLVRGAVGGALLGPAGLLAGGLSGKNKVKNKTTFLVTYDDGTSMNHTVEDNGILYNSYMAFINKKK